MKQRIFKPYQICDNHKDRNSGSCKATRKTLTAQITILASISITIVLSLLITLVRSAADSRLNTQIKQACILSAESVFAAYHNDCLEEFGIFLLKDASKNEAKLSKYINTNLSDVSSKVYLDGLNITDYQYATSNCGEGVYEEILSYMKYGIYSDLVDSFKNSEEEVKRAKATKEISEDMAGLEEDLVELDVNVLRLLEVVEGIDTTDDGVVIKNGKPQLAKKSYAKRGIYGEISMSSANIDNDKVYKVLNSSDYAYINLEEIVDDMYICLEELELITDEESNANGNNSYANIFKRDYDKLEEYITDTKKANEEAMGYIKAYYNSQDTASKSVDDLTTKLSNNKESLGQELYDSFAGDYEEIKNGVKNNERKLCNVDLIKEAITSNNIYLNNAEDKLSCIKETLTKDKITEYKSSLDSIKSNLSKISNKNLKFDYSQIDFSSSSSGLSKIKKIISTLQEGYLGLIIDDVSTISDKSINYKDLANSLSGDEIKTEISLKDTKDNIFYNEYLTMHFKDAADFLDEDGKLKKSDTGQLDYMIEFILCGNSSDKENLSKTLFEMSGIREGMNLAYLLTDSTKKAEAYTLALSLVGFTGCEAAVRAGQYLILSAWAYGESIMDLRTLMKGGKVPLVKTKDNWQLSLTNLLDSNFTNNKNDDKGLAYEDYLRMLLLVKNLSKKNLGTMAAMELQMIDMGHTDFRMKDYIVSFKGEASFKKSSKTSSYKQEISYSYIN